MRNSLKRAFTFWLGASLLTHLIWAALVAGILYKQFTNLPLSVDGIADYESGRIALMVFLVIGVTAFSGSLAAREGRNRVWDYAVLLYCCCVAGLAILAWTTGLIVSVYSPLDLLWFVAGGVLSALRARRRDAGTAQFVRNA